jgi:mRNA-degrading endonuclease RelE of RelBE toxin-antitoxin system
MSLRILTTPEFDKEVKRLAKKYPKLSLDLKTLLSRGAKKEPLKIVTITPKPSPRGAIYLLRTAIKLL